MRNKKTVLITMVTVLSLIVGTGTVLAGNTNLVSDLDLTKEQIQKLGQVVESFSAKKMALGAKIDKARMGLAQELRKGDRWDSEAKIKASSKIVNRHVKQLASLGGDLLKLKVEYFSKAKDVFTDDQRMVILGALTEYEMASRTAFPITWNWTCRLWIWILPMPRSKSCSNTGQTWTSGISSTSWTWSTRSSACRPSCCLPSEIPKR